MANTTFLLLATVNTELATNSETHLVQILINIKHININQIYLYKDIF